MIKTKHIYETPDMTVFQIANDTVFCASNNADGSVNISGADVVAQEGWNF